MTSLSERDRIEYSCQKQDYSFLNYLAYVLYSPLYLAGPIITFNYYVSQVPSTRTFGGLMAVAIPLIDDFNAKDNVVWSAIFFLAVDNGSHITLHVRRRHLQNSCVGRIKPLPTEHDLILQSPNNMAQSSFLLTPRLMTVTSAMAILPIMGNGRWY